MTALELSWTHHKLTPNPDGPAEPALMVAALIKMQNTNLDDDCSIVL